jgi:predicted O-methyltransferase YrrM
MTGAFLAEDYAPESPWCPHPERWHSTLNESGLREETEIEVSELVAAFVRGLQPDYVLETGTAKGQTTEMMAAQLKRNGFGHLYTLDMSAGRLLAVASRLEAEYKDYITYVEGASQIWEPPADVSFDFAFIDCDFHIRPEVVNHFRPWFHPGTILALHDVGPIFAYGPIEHGCGEARLEPLIAEGYMRMAVMHNPRGLAICEVL